MIPHYCNMSTMKTNIYIGIVVLLVIVGTLLYGNNKGTEQKNTIKIGASLSLTGVAADFGEMAKKASLLAVEEINSKGGIKGRKVELYIEDDQTDPKTAVSAYRKLVDVHGVEAVIGGLFDFTAQPVFPLAEKEKITYISPINFVIDDVFEMNPYTFVMYPRFDQVVRELDSVIGKLGVKHLGMIRYESGFSKSIQDTLAEVMGTKGKFTVETYKAIGSSDFRTNILKLVPTDIDAVFLDMLDFDIVKYMQESKNLGFKKQIVGYTTLRDVLKSDKVDTQDLEGAIMLDWEIPSPEFSKAFFEAYGEYPRRGANKTYDAVYVLSQAIANTESKAEVPEYIVENRFETKNGTFTFGQNHAVLDTPVQVLQVKNGGFVEIKSN